MQDNNQHGSCVRLESESSIQSQRNDLSLACNSGRKLQISYHQVLLWAIFGLFSAHPFRCCDYKMERKMKWKMLLWTLLFNEKNQYVGYFPRSYDFLLNIIMTSTAPVSGLIDTPKVAPGKNEMSPLHTGDWGSPLMIPCSKRGFFSSLFAEIAKISYQSNSLLQKCLNEEGAWPW